MAAVIVENEDLALAVLKEAKHTTAIYPLATGEFLFAVMSIDENLRKVKGAHLSKVHVLNLGKDKFRYTIVANIPLKRIVSKLKAAGIIVEEKKEVS